MKKKVELNPIEEYATQIVREISHWNYILENGCSDPFWPDGANMNLIRNHIISYKLEIAECCEATGSELPSEYYLPTPPEVDNDYLAIKKGKRADSLRVWVDVGDQTKEQIKKMQPEDGQLTLL
jgi:hypothetical protein